MATDFLTTADVLGMHFVLIQKYGGLSGVRDPGALEAALYRPQTGYYKDTIEQAAALMESLAINHPFVDGNKRIAWSAGRIFCLMNKCDLQMNIDDAEKMILDIAKGEIDVAEIAQLLKKAIIQEK